MGAPDRVRGLGAALVLAMDARDLRTAEAILVHAGPDLDAVAAEVWRIEARRWCRNPLCDRTRPGPSRRGYCPRCYDRWRAHGFPAAGPPEPRDDRAAAAARLEDFQWLRAQRESLETAAARVGWAPHTARTWETRMRRAA